MGGLGGMGDMFKSMMGKMNMPKDTRVDANKMSQAQKHATLKERLKARALAKKQDEVVKQLEEKALRIRKEREYNEYMAANPKLMEELMNDSTGNDPNALTSSQKKRAKKKAKKQSQSQKENVQESA